MRAVSFIPSAVAALSFLVFASHDARAQGACTGAPGEVVVGMAGGGPGGFQTPLCSSSGGGGAAAQPKKTEAERRNEQISTQFKSEAHMMMAGLDMMLHQINRRQRGFWEHFGPSKTLEGNFQYCSAFFLKGNHLLMIWGSNNPENQATLTLVDMREEPAMLPVDEPKVQQVTLVQTGAQPVTVNAIRNTFTDKAKKFGAVTFVIPSLEMAASGIKPQMSIKVSAEGKELIAIDYSGGNAARAWLESCIQKIR